MSESTTEPPPEIETWTTENVHQWLTTEVKVQQSCADRFIEEEVAGKDLTSYKKKDILDLGIKHGPAVKIMSYLERIKEGSQHVSQFPAEVENWSSERVKQWLLQDVKVDNKKAERLQEEDVSGDCLVCFGKQDFLDLELKKGPAVRILKELGRLKDEPEQTQLPKLKKKKKKKEKNLQKESQNADLPLENPSSENEEAQQPTKPQETRTRETVVNPTVVIKNNLDKLGRRKLQSFKFQLQIYEKDPIPLCELEDEDTKGIATLVTNHYGPEEALTVTRDIFMKIKRLDLVSKVDCDMSGASQSHTSSADTKDDTEASELPSSTKREKEKKKKKKSCLCFVNVKIHLPSCFD